MSGKIADLYADVGFRFDQVKLREVAKYIGDINIASLISVGSLVSLGEGIKKLVEDTAALTMNLATISANTGINPVFLQQLEDVSFALGSTKEDADNLISSLSKIRQSIKFGGNVPRGLALMGINYQDIMGPEEDLIKKINKILSQKPELKTQQQKENWAAFISSINQDLGASPAMLKVLTDTQMIPKMNEFFSLSAEDIKESTDATQQWRTAITQLNTEFLKLSVSVLPLVNSMSALLKGVADFIHASEPENQPKLTYGPHGNRMGNGTGHAGRSGYRSSPEEIHAFNTFWHDFWSGESNTRKSIAEPEKATATLGAAKIVTIKIDPITIHAKNATDFGKEFQSEFTKALNNATSQFGLGQT